MSLLLHIHWGLYLGCDKCKFAQHFANPQVLVVYKARGPFGFGTTYLHSEPHYAWCENCEGLVVTEDPRIIRNSGAHKFNESQYRNILKLMSKDDPEYESKRDAANRNSEWAIFTRRAKRQHKALRCLRCGNDSSSEVNFRDPQTIDPTEDYAEPVCEHPRCSDSGVLIQLNYSAIKNQRFLDSAKLLEYRYPNVTPDYHGNQCIELDAEGNYLGPSDLF